MGKNSMGLLLRSRGPQAIAAVQMDAMRTAQGTADGKPVPKPLPARVQEYGWVRFTATFMCHQADDEGNDAKSMNIIGADRAFFSTASIASPRLD